MNLLKKLFACALIAGLAACGKPGEKFNNTDLTGLDYAQDFALTDHNGKARTLKDFRGKLVVIFFGYTQCPDVCPTTMVEMANVMQKMGPQADKVQVLFVTIDPERDTQALMAAYVPNFDSRFLGLYGDAAATAKVAKDFKVYYQKVDGKRRPVTPWITRRAAMSLTPKAASVYSCAMDKVRNLSFTI